MSRTHALPMLVLGSMLLAACGDAADSANDAATATDDELPFYCGEARGTLLELALMTSGRQVVDTSKLSTTHLYRLADKVSAPSEVRQDIDGWNHACDAWGEKRTAMQPRFENGRLIEPDTSELDKALLNEMAPRGKRLSAWVTKVCGDP